MENQNQNYKEDLVKLLEIDLDKNAIRIEDVNIMFLDVSSTCIGYSIANVDFKSKRSKIVDSGCIWFHTKWKHQFKYNYIFHAIVNYFWIVKKVDHIVVEQYSVNPKKMMGVNVVSEMQGVIKCAAEENGVNVTTMPVQTWRSILGIKPDKSTDKNGKTVKDYKTPTKNKIKEYVDIPDKVVSNITNSERKTPSDIYDALAISLAWLEKNNFRKPTFNEININPHIGGIK